MEREEEEGELRRWRRDGLEAGGCWWWGLEACGGLEEAGCGSPPSRSANRRAPPLSSPPARARRYGQTGSGKTHTMSGTDVASYAGRGINFRALDDLFDLHRQRSGEVRGAGRAGWGLGAGAGGRP